jgi:tryptophan-rich sensory protein
MPDVRAARPGRRKAMAALWAAIGAVLVAGVGGLLTELGPWYAALQQPPWKPPDLWFGPAWTLIFTLTAVAGARAWLAEPDTAARRRLVAAFGLNGVLNVLWSGLFFKLRRPDWALAEVGLLWLSIVLLIVVSARSDHVAAWLLLPYLAWVAFAAALNLAVVQLNGPF